MWLYVVRRVLVSIPLLFGLLTLTFFLIHLAPGDPTDIFYNPDLTPEAQELLRKAYGLDQPLHRQYVRYILSMLKGNFGPSLAKHQDVRSLIRQALPNTLLLTGISLAFSMGLGILLGTGSAVFPASWFDRYLSLAALVLYSVPTFWIGLVLIMIFSVALGILPAGGTVNITIHEHLSFWEAILDRLVHLILPALALSLPASAEVARYMRSSMLEVLHEDYIRTARSKGLAMRAIIWRHALWNALGPMITLLGLSLPFLFSGAVIIEEIFSWPGMGRIGIDAVFQRDYPVIMAVTLLLGVLVVVGNLLADLLYALVDPRITY